jgi:hypothetical protein
MNLDIYVSTHRDFYPLAPCEEREDCAKILNIVGLTPFSPVDSIPFIEIKLHAADLKNAWHVFHWFTLNVEGGEDRDEELPVSRKQLSELFEICNRLLIHRDPREANAALPLPDDLFRDKSQERKYWSEAYWPHVEDTARQLGAILVNPKFTAGWWFSYRLGP